MTPLPKHIITTLQYKYIQGESTFPRYLPHIKTYYYILIIYQNFNYPNFLHTIIQKKAHSRCNTIKWRKLYIVPTENGRHSERFFYSIESLSKDNLHHFYTVHQNIFSTSQKEGPSVLIQLIAILLEVQRLVRQEVAAKYLQERCFRICCVH